MKAVVVELKNNYAAVLSDDGSVTTVKNNNYEIGQIIQLQSSTISMIRKLSMLTACVAACIILSTGVWAYASPYIYVSVDVNPSIEFSINRFDRVISAKAVNQDGEDILKSISLTALKNKNISKALSITVDQISKAGYFDHKTGGIVITASCKNTEKASDLADELKEATNQTILNNGDKAEVDSFSVSQDRVKQAKELGVTPGKLNLVEKLKAAAGNSEQININEWLKKPVKDIIKATKAYKNETKKGISDNQNDTKTDNTIDDNHKNITNYINDDSDASNNFENPNKNTGKKTSINNTTKKSDLDSSDNDKQNYSKKADKSDKFFTNNKKEKKTDKELPKVKTKNQSKKSDSESTESSKSANNADHSQDSSNDSNGSKKDTETNSNKDTLENEESGTGKSDGKTAYINDSSQNEQDVDQEENNPYKGNKDTYEYDESKTDDGSLNSGNSSDTANNGSTSEGKNSNGNDKK